MPENPEALTYFGLTLRRWRILGIILSVVFVLGLTTARGLLKPYLDTGDIAGAKLSAEGGSKESGLFVREWIDRDRAVAGEPFRIWFKFSNPSTEASRVESLDLYTPGFTVEGPHLKVPNFQGDRITTAKTKGDAARVLVRGGESESRWATVRPTEWKGTSLVTAQIAWTSHGKRFQDTLELGPIRETSPWLESSAQLTDSLFSLLVV